MPAVEFKPKRRTDRDVIAYAEFSGLRNDIAPERFDATDLLVANNVTLDKSRRIARRTGATKRNPAPAHSLWASGSDALFASGTQLWRLSAALVPTLLTQSLSGQPVAYARGGDHVYFSDGVSTGAALDSSARSWGLEVPSVMATVIAGGLTPGGYGVTATYVRSDGQESGADASSYLNVLAGQTVAITVPHSIDPDVTAARVYMTTPNGEVPFHIATLANGGTYIASAADVAAMNEELTTQFMGPPPVGQCVAYFKGRMWIAAGDVLYPSQPFAYELFDLRDYIQLDAPVTMLAPMEDASGPSGFFVGTSASCGVLVGDTPEDFKYVTRTSYGAVQGALAYVDGALYQDGSIGARPVPLWLTTQGLCVGLPSLEINNLTRSRYTFPIDGIGAAMFDPQSNTFVAVSGAHPAIVLQVENQTLTTFSNYHYNSFARVAGRNMAASAQGLFELVGEDDDGVPISGTVTLGTTDFGSTFIKTIDRLFVGYRSKADMIMQIITDDDTANLYTLPISDQAGLATQRVKVGRGLAGRYWQFTLQNLDGTDFTLDTIDVKSAQLARRINGRA